MSKNENDSGVEIHVSGVTGHLNSSSNRAKRRAEMMAKGSGSKVKATKKKATPAKSKPKKKK